MYNLIHALMKSRLKPITQKDLVVRLINNKTIYVQDR